jgi:tetratricopeptide (TPR) repeat protein
MWTRVVAVADTHNNMGALYCQLGDYGTALFHYKTALSIDRLSLGDSHASVEGTYTNGIVHWKALKIFKTSLGYSHASVAGTYVNMETCLNSMGRYEEAWDVYVKSLEINKQCLGEDHAATANSKWGLADVFKYYKAALVLYEQVLTTQNRCLGTGHVSCAMTQTHIGSTYKKLGNTEKAMMPLNTAYVAEAKNIMGAVYKQLNDQNLAKKLFQEAYDSYKQCLGPKHPDTLKAAQDLAQM